MSANALNKKLNRPGNIRFYKQLTREIVGPSSVRNLLINIFGILFIVFLVNWAALWYLDHYPQNRGYWLIKEKWRLLSTIKEPIEWLILGDSSGNQGMIPDMLEAKLGGPSINLCTIGTMTLLHDAWMLETYINRFGPPKNVIIVQVYDAWHRKAPKPVMLAQIPLAWGFWNRLTLDLKMNIQEQIEIFIARYLPLYAENYALKKIIKKPKNLFKNDFNLNPDGYMPYYKSYPQMVKNDAKRHLKFVAENEVAISAMNQEALFHIITLAERHKINVFIVNSPLYEVLYRNNQFQNYFVRLQDQLKWFADKSNYVYYMGNTVTFPIEQMENVDHVIHPAAEIYTHSIASEILKLR